MTIIPESALKKYRLDDLRHQVKDAAMRTAMRRQVRLGEGDDIDLVVTVLDEWDTEHPDDP